jgi:hypothetical protein
MLFLPISCPDCMRLTMEVVEYRGHDSYEARCRTCSDHSFGKMIRKGAIDSTPQKTG